MTPTKPAYTKGDANAHLIAAAPEMLGALELFLVWADVTLEKPPANLIEFARSAVAKAEGRS